MTDSTDPMMSGQKEIIDQNETTGNYGKLLDILELIFELQAKNWFTLEDIITFIKDKRGTCSRRTAERIRDMLKSDSLIEAVGLTGDRQKKWKMIGSTFLKTGCSITTAQVESFQTVKKMITAFGYQDLLLQFKQIAPLLFNTFPAEEREEIKNNTDKMAEKTAVAWFPRASTVINGKVAETIRHVLLGTDKVNKLCHQIEITYLAPHNEVRKATVRPIGTTYANGTQYLIHRNEYADETVLYDMSAITSAKELDSLFDIDVKLDIDEFAEKSFGISGEKPFPVELRFHPKAVASAKRWTFHPRQKCSDNEDGSMTVKFTAAGILEMAWFLQRWGKNVEVVSPANFWDNARKAQEQFEKNGCMETVVPYCA